MDGLLTAQNMEVEGVATSEQKLSVWRAEFPLRAEQSLVIQKIVLLWPFGIFFFTESKIIIHLVSLHIIMKHRLLESKA